jgi:hypothetical protein
MKQKEFNKIFVELVRSPDQTSQNELLACIKDGPKLSGIRALEVYQEDYQARLTEALKNTYSAIYSIIGEEDFQRLSLDYIKSYPSKSCDLDDYGNNFSFFITTHSLCDDYLFLSELAHFEWNFREIFHLEQVVGADSAALAVALSEVERLVQLVKSVRVFDYHYSITSLYQLKENENQDENDQHFDFMIPQFLLMFKENGIVKTHVLTKGQWEVVSMLQTKNSLLSILNALPESTTPEDIQSLFQILGSTRLLSMLS